MLDKKSEKVLAIIIKKNLAYPEQSIPLDECDVKNSDMPYEVFCAACQNLRKQEYLKNLMLYSDSHSGYTKISSSGLLYFDQKKADRIDYYKKLAISKTSDVAVSAIIALITSLLVA